MTSSHTSPRPNESTLHPSLSLALDLTRRAGGINNYEAENHGHATLTQRVHDLADLGYQFFSHSKSNLLWSIPLIIKSLIVHPLFNFLHFLHSLNLPVAMPRYLPQQAQACPLRRIGSFVILIPFFILLVVTSQSPLVK